MIVASGEVCKAEKEYGANQHRIQKTLHVPHQVLHKNCAFCLPSSELICANIYVVSICIM